ncbi:MAG: CapA family protein [Syntrophomonadaceae bacterium]|nr:CapA family protein [Syntrophomonadaceae bacterium]
MRQTETVSICPRVFLIFGGRNLLKRTGIVLLLIILGIAISLNIHILIETVKLIPAATSEKADKGVQHSQVITLTAAGDCLMHNTQIWSGLMGDGSYCFDTFFSEVKYLVEEGDYSLINFEAPMAGPDSGYTGYPLFNSPDAIVQAFKDAGFDLVVTANNHALDRGYQGAIRTLEVLHAAGLDTVGTYKSEQDSRTFLIKDIKGVKIGFLAYSYGTNGIPVPDEHAYLFNFLDRDKILTDIKKLRSQVDILVLILHWGVEYSSKPTAEQEIMAREFLQAGADVILGGHPHVIQTMEAIKIGEKNKFVIYSMGNFISHQRGRERNSGIVLKIKFSKDFSKGDTFLEEVSYTPTYSHSYYENGKMKFRVIPVEQTIRKIKQGKERYLGSEHLPLLQAVLDHTSAQLGPFFRR